MIKTQKLFYVLCLFISINACQKNTNKNKNVLNYHAQIIKAEQLIAQEHYENALSLYDKVINEYPFTFLRDYKIASQLALYTNKKEKALQYIKQSIISGWELDELKENKVLIKHLNATDWEQLESEYNNLRKQYLKNINSKIRAQVESMYEKDQNIAFKASEIEDEDAQETFINNTFPPHSENQIQGLINILENTGYPGELLIGNNFWMSTILSHHNSISEAYVKKDTLYNFIKPKLHKALSKGHISPYEFAIIEDWKKAVVSDSEAVSYGFINAPNASNLSEINKNRTKIGLRPVELRNDLVDIQIKTNMTFYLPDWVEGKISIEK